MNTVNLKNPLFKKHNFTLYPKNNLLRLPDSTVHLNQILPELLKKLTYTKEVPKIPLALTKEVRIAPKPKVLLESFLSKISDQCNSCTGLVFPPRKQM